jgi:uncharacterized Zn-binding protein involved in type VI secretion
MPRVARGKGKDTVSTGHLCTATTNTDKCSTNVFVNNIGVCRKGDAIKVHTHKVGDKCVNHTETIKAGSATVFVNNIPIARDTDKADAGTISSGSDNVYAGDSTSSVSANEPPTAIANAFTITKRVVKHFTQSDFKFKDIDNNSISAVIISKLPKVGRLKLGKANVKANQSVPSANVSLLAYYPDGSKNGTQHAAIGFKIKDSGGTLNKGKDTSSESTITITIKPK